MATAATDLKRLLAYSSLSHMGLVVLGALTFTLTGLQGSIFQMVSHGAAMAGLFFLAGWLEEREGKRGLGDFGGLASSMPLMAVAFLWMMLAAVGLPGFSGFIGELLVLSAVWKSSPVLAGVALLGFVLSAWYLFNLYGKVFLGPAGKGKVPPDLSLREGLAILPLAALVLWLGLQPNVILRPVEKTLTLKVMEELKPPPAMTDFAATHRRLQEEVEKDKRNRRKGN
jgi:NADH-quinone oxidoreductase subunit M